MKIIKVVYDTRASETFKSEKLGIKEYDKDVLSFVYEKDGEPVSVTIPIINTHKIEIYGLTDLDYEDQEHYEAVTGP
jgi:hypothetical protein